MKLLQLRCLVVYCWSYWKVAWPVGKKLRCSQLEWSLLTHKARLRTFAKS